MDPCYPPVIPLVTLLAWKGAMKLEALGMKRRGRSVTAIARERMGLRKGAPREKVMEAVQCYQDEFYPKGDQH